MMMKNSYSPTNDITTLSPNNDNTTFMNGTMTNSLIMNDSSSSSSFDKVCLNEKKNN